METQTIVISRTAQDIGQPISREFAGYLTNGFKHNFPGETTSVFISRETILKAIENLDHVSGIRFMYGFEDANNPESRVVLLLPCNDTSVHKAIPNTIILNEGYMAHTGIKVEFKKTWQLLYNHVVRFGSYFPQLPYNRIMRGTFMGINSLLSLLQTDDCAGIQFSFGYDDTVADVSARNKPVFEAVNFSGWLLDSPYDFTTPCPAYCDFTLMENIDQVAYANKNAGGFTGLTLTNHFRDEYLLKDVVYAPLVELFYYANPTITEKVTGDKKSLELYENTCRSQVAAFNRLLAEGNYHEAKTAFEDTLTTMMKTCLFQ